MMSLDQVLDLLSKYHQRATYGAVAELVGGHARSVLQGRKRNWRHSWVVNQDTGMPTEYPSGMIHPAIAERPEILCSAEELREWIAGRMAPRDRHRAVARGPDLELGHETGRRLGAEPVWSGGARSGRPMVLVAATSCPQAGCGLTRATLRMGVTFPEADNRRSPQISQERS